MHPKTLLPKVLSYQYFTDEKPLLQVQYTPGASRLVIVTGENASGKSFFARLMAAYCHFRLKTEPILVDMRLRTAGGIERAFVFGDEGSDSTGNISLASVINGIKTCQGRETNHYLIYDEPEIGLSDGYQMALGNYFAKFMEDLPKRTKGLVIATHSKYVVQPLVSYNPHHIRFGDNLALEEWLEQEPKEKSEKELLALHHESANSYRAIASIVQNIRERNRTKRKRAA